MFSGLWAILKKEVIHIKRDPATRFIFAIPLFELLLFGYAIDTDVKHVPTVVFDLNRQQESRQLVQEFETPTTFVWSVKSCRIKICTTRSSAGGKSWY